MKVPLLWRRLCMIYQSFWNDIIYGVSKSLKLFMELIFCKSDVYFQNRHTQGVGDHL